MIITERAKRREHEETKVDLLGSVISITLRSTVSQTGEIKFAPYFLRDFVHQMRTENVKEAVLISDAIAGKTHVIGRLAKEYGELDMYDWGEAFQVAIRTGLIPNKEYGNFTPEELSRVSSLFEDEIYWGREQSEGSGRLSVYKAPAICMAVVEGKKVGIDRAYTTFRKICRREGRFSKFHKSKISGISIVADPEVRERGKLIRFEAKMAKNPSELRGVYAKYGENVSQLDDEELWIYAKVGANVKAAEQIEDASNALAESLVGAGVFKGEPRLLAAFADQHNLKKRPQDRFGMLGLYLIPEILTGEENFRLDPHLVFVGRNVHIPNIPFVSGKINRPIRDRYNLK